MIRTTESTIEQRVAEERARTAVLLRQLECECPADCDVQHDG